MEPCKRMKRLYEKKNKKKIYHFCFSWRYYSEEQRKTWSWSQDSQWDWRIILWSEAKRTFLGYIRRNNT
jgi:hypothetical protein